MLCVTRAGCPAVGQDTRRSARIRASLHCGVAVAASKVARAIFVIETVVIGYACAVEKAKRDLSRILATNNLILAP